MDRFNYVFILMEIDREMFPGMFEENLTSVIEKNVAQGLRARIEPQGVTGINFIDINYVNDPSQFPHSPSTGSPTTTMSRRRRASSPTCSTRSTLSCFRSSS